jgi:hypothetical protein
MTSFNPGHRRRSNDTDPRLGGVEVDLGARAARLQARQPVYWHAPSAGRGERVVEEDPVVLHHGVLGRLTSEQPSSEGRGARGESIRHGPSVRTSRSRCSTTELAGPALSAACPPWALGGHGTSRLGWRQPVRARPRAPARMQARSTSSVTWSPTWTLPGLASTSTGARPGSPSSETTRTASSKLSSRV